MVLNQRTSERPSNFIGYYWEIIENFGEDDVRHAIMTDAPHPGGWHRGMVARLACGPEFNEEVYGLRVSYNQKPWTRLQDITCPECYKKIEQDLAFMHPRY